MPNELVVTPRPSRSITVSIEVPILDFETVRGKELLGYVRLARLSLPFFNMHPCRKIDPHTELSMDLDQSVVWSEKLCAKAFGILEKLWCEFIQDPRWEVNLVHRALELAKERGFTEVQFYEAYAHHILTSGTSVYANATKVMQLFREGRIATHRDYGREA